MIRLSKRLKEVASFVTSGKSIADIGTDHGYVPIYLVMAGKVPRAIAMDINEGPLKRAEENILKYGLQKHIETRLSDGLLEYNKGEADSIIMSGMGGRLIISMLSACYDKWSENTELILSPHSEVELVRRYLCENGMTIADESMVTDDGKYYVVMRAKSGVADYKTKAHYMYGKVMLEKRDAVLYEYLKKEADKNRYIAAVLRQFGSDSSNKRIGELMMKQAVLEDALSYYEN